MNNEDWQIPHIEKVLAYHNKSYGTDFVLLGRYEDSCPTLKDTEKWDWVCVDNKAAIEVKRLTDERKHEEYFILKRVKHELQGQLSHRVRGTYHLLLTTGDRPLNLGGNKEKSTTIEKLHKTLGKLVREAALGMRVQKSLDLSDELRASLPNIVPADFYAELRKVKNEGACLAIDIMPYINAPSSALQGKEFTKFKTLVHKANGQLHQAKVRRLPETFLILLDLLYFLAADPDAIRDTFHQLDPKDHYNIDYVYYVESTVTRIKP